MELKGKSIAITGGTSGVGRALVDQLAPANRLLVIARATDRLNALARAFPNLEAVACDLADLNSTAALGERLAARTPPIDILINNAGIQRNGDFASEAFDPAEIAREIAVNFVAPAILARSAVRGMRRGGRPGIVLNIGSALAVAPKRSAPIYCASKAALWRFSRSLRYQLEGSPIRCLHAMLPLVDTPMTRGRGRGKLVASAVARALIGQLRTERAELWIGKARLLAIVYRIAPSLAYRVLKDA